LKGQIKIHDETIELIGMVEPVNEEKFLYNILFPGCTTRRETSSWNMFSVPTGSDTFTVGLLYL